MAAEYSYSYEYIFLVVSSVRMEFISSVSETISATIIQVVDGPQNSTY